MDLQPDLLSEIGLGKAGISRAYGTKDLTAHDKSTARKQTAATLGNCSPKKALFLSSVEKSANTIFLEIENQEPLLMTTCEYREETHYSAGEYSPNLIDFSSPVSNNEPPAFKYGRISRSQSRRRRCNWKGDARQPSPSPIRYQRSLREERQNSNVGQDF